MCGQAFSPADLLHKLLGLLGAFGISQPTILRLNRSRPSAYAWLLQLGYPRPR